MPDYSKTRIQLRRGTAAELAAANPVLGQGEPAFATDTNNLKIGDGSTAYSSLSAISGGGGGGGSEVNDLTASVTWANVPDANITESSVVQHSGALQVTESQVVDLGSYITTETDPVFIAHTVNSITDGTGLLQNDGAGNWSYDNSTYLTSVTNIDTTNFNATAIVTETEGISSNDNDTTLPTSAAVKDYVDNNAGTTYTAGDGLTLTGTEFSADLLSDTSAVANSVQITNIVAISQNNYNSLGSYDANTLYYIT